MLAFPLFNARSYRQKQSEHSKSSVPDSNTAKIWIIRRFQWSTDRRNSLVFLSSHPRYMWKKEYLFGRLVWLWGSSILFSQRRDVKKKLSELQEFCVLNESLNLQKRVKKKVNRLHKKRDFPGLQSQVWRSEQVVHSGMWCREKEYQVMGFCHGLGTEDWHPSKDPDAHRFAFMSSAFNGYQILIWPQGKGGCHDKNWYNSK